MGWEYSDTNCKFKNVCSFSPRCTCKSRYNCCLYEKDERNIYQKLFYSDKYNEKILMEFKEKSG